MHSVSSMLFLIIKSQNYHIQPSYLLYGNPALKYFTRADIITEARSSLVHRASVCPSADSGLFRITPGSEKDLRPHQVHCLVFTGQKSRHFHRPTCAMPHVVTAKPLPCVLDQGPSPSPGFSLLLSSGCSQIHKLDSSKSCF